MSRDPRPRDAGGRGGERERERLPLASWATQAGAVDDVLDQLQVRLRRRRARRIRASFGAVALLVAGVFAWNALAARRETASPAAAGRLVVSQPSRQELTDGSIVELRAGAEISVEYSDRVRRVTLRRGEAHFAVAKDPTKPFVVLARGVAVSALGTAFSVDAATEKIEVLVTEGRVAVERPAPAAATTLAPASPELPGPMAVLDAGKRLVVAADTSSAEPPSVQSVTAAELDARLAWRVPRLEFAGTPLHEIVPAINRHSRVRVTVADPDLNAIRLSGSLRADDSETLIGLLEEGHGVRVERRGPTELALHKRR